MKKIVCFVSSMDTGGAETFLMKLYRAINKDNYQFDFIINEKHKGYYDEEIQEFGGHIFYSPKKSRHLLSNLVTSYQIIKKGHYDTALRMTSHSLGTLDLLVAKFAGVKQLILRSTNADSTGGTFSRYLHRIFCFLPRWIPTIKIAPSIFAAEYLFGKACVKHGDVKLLQNGIPLKKFIFSEKLRKVKRNELGLEGKTIVGHIGRFNIQKNHKYLIDIFSKVYEMDANTILLLIGTGELEEQIKNQVELLGLSNVVIFLGIREDIPELLMSMDVFVFPSFFEGMPNAVIEAQATGVPCLLSDRITPEAVIGDYVYRLSLEQGPEDWANRILSARNRKRERAYEKMISAGYDISLVVETFKNLLDK